MPYGTVNLKHGVPSEETSVTCTAGIGTFIIEFGALSRLTGDPIYEEVSLNALYALFNHRSSIGLVGNHIDVQSGVWTAQDAGIGAGVDSYYEYLVKGSIMLNRPELMHMFNEGRAAIDKYLKRDDWHIWASMNKGQMTLPVFQSLQAFWPGLLSLLGDINTAMKTLHNYHSVWKQYGFLPEFYNIPNAEAGANRDSYPLRPELIESVMYLYRATGDPYLLEVGEDILKSIQYSAKTPCGYATIKNVRDHKKQDSMESFFLAETTKYLYLLFDSDNFLNSDGSVGTVIETPNGECIMETGIFGYIFNTEAHPIDLGALKCCHDMPRESLVKGFNRQKFLGDTVEVNMEKNTPEVFETILKTEITYESDDDDPVKSTNDFKKVLVNEIMSALTNAKKKIEENIDLQKRFTEITNREKDGYFNIEKNVVELGSKVKENIKDDSLVLADLPKTEESDEFEDDTEKVPIEIIKLPLEALDSDAISSKPTVVEEDAPIVRKIEIEDTIVKGPSIDNKTIEKDYNRIINNHSESNNSFLADFAQILHFTNIPRKKFDSQKLLEKIRVHGYQKNESLTTKYELLTCKAQPYLQRISVMGEFY